MALHHRRAAWRNAAVRAVLQRAAKAKHIRFLKGIIFNGFNERSAKLYRP